MGNMLKRMNRKTIFTGLMIVVYLLFGVALWCRGSGYEEIRNNENQSVMLNANSVLAQKISGNDYSINDMMIYISDENISSNGTLNVYLMLGGYDLKKDPILGEYIFRSSDLAGKNEFTVAFPDTKLLYGRDYYVVCDYTDQNEKGYIQFKCDENYGGVYVNDIHYGVSLKYTIEYFSHYSKLLFLWTFFGVFGPLIIGLIIWKKVPFWEAASVVCVFSIMWLYIFGIFRLLVWGYYSLLILAFLSVLYILKKVYLGLQITNQIDWKDLLCGIILVGLYLLADSGKILHFTDEFSHWGTAARDMYWSDSLWLHKGSTVTLFRYPPTFTLFQYLLLKMYGRFSPGILHFAKHMLETSIIMFCINRGRRLKISSVCSVSLCIGIPELFFVGCAINGIYNDVTIGVLFGYTLIWLGRILKEDRIYDKILFCLSAIVCILLKDSGLILILALACAIVLTVIFQFIREKCLNKRWCTAAGLTVASTLIGRISWQLYLKYNAELVMDAATATTNGAINTVVASGLQNNAVLRYLSGNGENYQYSIIGEHVKQLLFGNYYENNLVSLSVMGWLFIIVSSFLILRKLYRFDSVHRDYWVFFFGMTLAVIFAYQLLYTFTFSEEEALCLAEERRYMGQYILGVFLLVIGILSDSFPKEMEKVRVRVFAAIFIVVMLCTDWCGNFRKWVLNDPAKYGHFPEAAYYKATSLRERIREQDSVYIIAKTEIREKWFGYRYYLGLAQVGGMEYYPVVKEPEENEKQLSPQELYNEINDYTYLFVDECDDSFVENYGDMFENPQEIKVGELYLIPKSKEEKLRHM